MKFTQCDINRMSAAKKQYQSLLTDHKKRKERNGRLLAKLENIEKKAAFLQAKTDRIKSLKSIYKNNANKSATPVRQVFSPSARILTERVPLNVQDYSHNPLQYSNYRYERIYNEPNPIYTLKPITLDDAIEEISRRYVLVPKNQEDVLFPLPNDDLIQSNNPHPRRYDPYQKYSANKHHYEEDKNILQRDVDRSPKYFDDNEGYGSKPTNDSGISPGMGAGNYLSSSDDNVEGSGKNSAESDFCNEKDFKDKDDSTEKDTKAKISVNQSHSPELAINEFNKSMESTTDKEDVELKFDPQSIASTAAKIDPPVTKLNESTVKEILIGSEVKTKDTPITNLLEKNIKEKEISIDREKNVDEEAGDEPEKINPLRSTDVTFDIENKSNVLDEQFIENESNVLYASNDNITEIQPEEYEATEIIDKVNENKDEQDHGASVTENNDPQTYAGDGIQQNYPDENYTTEQQEEYIQEQTPIDSNQEGYPDEYNAEQYITGKEQPQPEYVPNQQSYSEYSPEQSAPEQLSETEHNQQNYSEEYLVQEQNGQTDNPIQEQAEYDSNQQYYDPNNANANIIDPNYVDPNYVDTNYVDPNYVDPNYIDPNYVDPNYVDPNDVDPNYVDPIVDSQNAVYPEADQYYTESNEYVEGETNEGTITTENQNEVHPVPDQYYSENNYTEGDLNTQEFPQEGTTNAEGTEQTYNGTKDKESAEVMYEDSAYMVDEITHEQYQQDHQEAVYSNIETSEDTNNPEQTYDETGQLQYNQSAENNNTYENHDNSQYYDDTAKADTQPNEENQNAAVKPLRILESDTEPEVSNREESSKQESDFDFSIAQ